MLRNHCRVAVFLSLGMLSLAFAGGGGPSFEYIFTSQSAGFPNDGFSWPASPTGLLDGESFQTPDAVEVYNFSGNNVFFDDNYLAAGNTLRIDSDAMWGNPNSNSVEFDFSNINCCGDTVSTVSFDLAFASASNQTPSFALIEVNDFDGRATQLFPELD